MNVTRHTVKLRIRQSGLTQKGFAEAYMVRDERTIKRWLAGSTIPDVAKRWLDSPPVPWPPKPRNPR